MFNKVFARKVDNIFATQEKRKADEIANYRLTVKNAVEEALENASVNHQDVIEACVSLSVVVDISNVARAMQLSKKHSYVVDGAKVWKVKRNRHVMLHSTDENVWIYVSKCRFFAVPSDY